MRLKIVIRIQNEILDGQTWFLFSNEPFGKKPVMAIMIEDFVWHSDDHFKSHLQVPGMGCTSVTIPGFPRVPNPSNLVAKDFQSRRNIWPELEHLLKTFSRSLFQKELSKIWILRNEIPRLSVWNLLAQVRVNVKNNKYKEVDGIVRSHIFFSWKNPWFCRLVNTSHRTSLHHLNLCSNQIIRGCLITVQCLLIQVTHVYHCSRHEVVFFLVSQFLLQILSRSFAPLPPFLTFRLFFLRLVSCS